MDSNILIQTFDNSPSVRLIKMRNADFFLAFVTSVFVEERAVGQEKLQMLLESKLDNQELIEEESNMERLVESNDSKAKRLIKEWTDKGFLTNYQNEEGEIIYELSSHSSKVLDWVGSLKKEDYIGTESKFKTLFSQLKELVEYTNEDREKRLELLHQRKEEIERQIKRLEMGDEVEVFEDYQIEPRFNALNKLAKELLSDFKEVDDNFKDIIRQIYQRQTDNDQKKELLSYIFDAYSELKNSQQGKSFYSFWEFLLSSELQKEWDVLTENLYNTLADRRININDTFLKEIKRHLFEAGEKVFKTNDRMSEKLSLIIRQNEKSNTEVTKQVINEIEKLLIEALRNNEKSNATLEYEEIEINLPTERQLTFTPSKEVEYMIQPQDSVLGIEDLERIGKLYNPYYVDRKVLRSRIDKILKDKGQTSIAEVIVENSGVEKGLSELFGYIAVLKDYKTYVSSEHTQSIAFCEDKSIEIPEIIITR